MDILAHIDGFEWDQGNIDKTWQKHGVIRVECEEVFFNQPLVVKEGRVPSLEESRYYALGKTDKGRLLFIVFTVRKKRLRVISARDMSKKERKIYYEQIEKGSKIQE